MKTISKVHAVIALGLIPWARAQSPPGEVVRHAGKLALHKPVKRELGPGQTDVYTMKLRAGRFVHLLVEKMGVDVLAVIADSQGRELVIADSPNRAFGAVPVSLVTGRSGMYTISVRKSPRTLEAGEYGIEWKELRRPSQSDRNRIEAEREIFRATQEERAPNEASRRSAIDGFQRAASLWHGLSDHYQEGLCLQRIGSIHYALGERQKALDCYGQALALFRAAKDTSNRSLTVAAPIRARRREKSSPPLTIVATIGVQDAEATTLNNLGSVCWELGETQKAVEYYDQALPLWRAAGDRAGEARSLFGAAIVYSELGEKDKALDYNMRALPVLHAIGDRRSEASTLTNIGLLYRNLGKAQEALDYYNEALLLHRAVGSTDNEANTLSNIGMVYQDLGDDQKALEYHNQALPIMHAAGSRRLEAYTLADIGWAHSRLGEKQKALDHFNQALPIMRSEANRAGEAYTLSGIGSVYSDLGDKQKALEYYADALRLQRAVGYRDGEAMTLNDMGKVYADLGEKPRALEQYLKALQLSRTVSRPMLEADILYNVMRYWESEGNAALAVFFGKQAVNLHQQMRRNIQSLNQNLQRSYLATVTETYRRLGDLLISQSRLAEAEQVLSLLKSQEYFDYVRRDADEASSLGGRLDLTPEELACEKRYREVADKLVGIGVERGELLAKKSLTASETARLEQLEKDLSVGNVEFERFLGSLAQDFSAKPVAALRVEQLRETQSVMENLREMPAGTVAIYTVVGEDKFRAILRTPDVQKAYEYPIKASDLNRRVLEFREVARDPALDPRPLGKELYDILIAPMAQDLRQAKARTLMFSLDGTLRYLPLAALYDGKQYLIEQYRVSVMTLASNMAWKDKPDVKWKAAGFGVTKSFEGAAALPSVSQELAGIIASKPGDAGVLSGEIELDGDFTQQNMRKMLLKRYQVVHIASHFRFKAGNETQSYLLLGDGGHLTLAELKTSANLFGGVQLLTLSACNTGMGDGTEVEGFGALAQRQGAKAVIASLWPVADESTSLLMQEFYRIRESSPGKTKLEALQETQLELLRGAGKAAVAGADRALMHETENTVAKPKAPPFATDPKAPFSHPYFWAPFFLMGNWL